MPLNLSARACLLQHTLACTLKFIPTDYMMIVSKCGQHTYEYRSLTKCDPKQVYSVLRFLVLRFLFPTIFLSLEFIVFSNSRSAYIKPSFIRIYLTLNFGFGFFSSFASSCPFYFWTFSNPTNPICRGACTSSTPPISLFWTRTQLHHLPNSDNSYVFVGSCWWWLYFILSSSSWSLLSFHVSAIVVVHVNTTILAHV